MSQSNHTPGPWQVVTNNSGVRVQSVKNAEDQDLAFIFLPYPVEDSPPDAQTEQQANARLIAAAPELLEACKLLLSSHTNADAYETACDKVRLVVAKAEGKL